MLRPDQSPPTEQPAYWFVVRGRELAVRRRAQGADLIPCWPGRDLPQSRQAYTAALGDYAGRPAYLLWLDEQAPAPGGLEWCGLRDLLLAMPQELFQLAGRACQVARFLTTHRYCGRCGTRMVQDRSELAVLCPECELRQYPRISPCMIVAVYRPGEVLLAQGRRHPEGLFSVLAGFVESGETLEQCVAREVHEESGVTVQNIEYVTSQPWPFPHSLMMGFIAEYDAGELVLQEDEIVAADWFSLDDLPRTPPPGTIAARLIQEVRERQSG